MSDYDSIIINTGDDCCALELVPEFGGLSNQLYLTTGKGEKVSVFAGLANRHAMQKNVGFHGVHLFPFPSRIEKGCYRYRGNHYQFEQNESSRNNALHGFLYNMPAKLLTTEQADNEASAILRYEYTGNLKAYPFPVEIDVLYHLSTEKGLSVQFTVKNRHHETIPIGAGWHPYFYIGQPADHLRLKLPSVRKIDLDDRLLPTGKFFDFHDFENLSLINTRKFDNCFEIIDDTDQSVEELKKVSTQLFSDEKGYGIELWQMAGNKGCNYVQVYIPPDRQSVAIEPVSCGINAFNTGEGLIHLDSGESHSFHYGVNILSN